MRRAPRVSIPTKNATEGLGYPGRFLSRSRLEQCLKRALSVSPGQSQLNGQLNKLREERVLAAEFTRNRFLSSVVARPELYLR